MTETPTRMTSINWLIRRMSTDHGKLAETL
jgi:hypothetical protein